MKELIEELIKNDVFIKFYKKNKIKISQKNLKLLRERIIRDHRNPKSVIDYKIKNGKPLYYIRSNAGHDIGRKMLFSEFEISPRWDKKQAKEHLKNVTLLDKKLKTISLTVPYQSKIQKVYESLGAKNAGVMLLATVDDSLKYLDHYEYADDISIETLNKKDLNEVVNLEYNAHKHSATTRVGKMPKKAYRDFYLMGLKHKHIHQIVLKEKGKIIGVIVLSINQMKVGHIMSIATKHQEQGRGVAKLLYHSALTYWKKKRVQVYSGFSTTAEVLSLAKRMKRQPQLISLNIKQK